CSPRAAHPLRCLSSRHRAAHAAPCSGVALGGGVSGLPSPGSSPMRRVMSGSNRRAMLGVLAGFAVLPASMRAAADPIAVKVVDVAGGAAYLTPGRAAGIVPGTKVQLRGVDLVVVEATEKTAL